VVSPHFLAIWLNVTAFAAVALAPRLHFRQQLARAIKTSVDYDARSAAGGPLLGYAFSMTDDEEKITVSNALDAQERTLAIHEAGHAVVAHGLGANVAFVEVYIGSPNPDDGKLGGGKTALREEMTDNIKNLAVCVAGYKAELAFAAHELEVSKMLAAHAMGSTRDFQQIQELLLRLPEVERLAALVEGFRLADEKLKANADVASKIADALFARRFEDKARIEGSELTELLAAVDRA
jgi:hypothetical protein